MQLLEKYEVLHPEKRSKLEGKYVKEVAKAMVQKATDDGWLASEDGAPLRSSTADVENEVKMIARSYRGALEAHVKTQSELIASYAAAPAPPVSRSCLAWMDVEGIDVM